ncbi:MAG: hypothetical protein IIC67_11730 [Thaumarchaeota archaeon]|nr:hypothetical protein [Nitrososphaerota archaeon]
MENESINVNVCMMCFHEHSSKCDKLVTEGIPCTCPMNENITSANIQTNFNETYKILQRLNECARTALIQISYVEAEHKSEQVNQAKLWAGRVYTLSSLFNSLVTPDMGDEHSPRSKKK